MPDPSILEDGKDLLPGFDSSLVDIGGGRKIVVFDRRPLSATQKLPVVFLHGFPDNATGFRLVAPQIVSAGHRCLLFSCPGYDAISTSTPGRIGRLTVESVARDYAGAIDSVLGSEKYHLVGHDWGALHASCMARHIHSHRIATLTMAAVPHGIIAGMKAFPHVQFGIGWYMAFFQLPFLPECWILGRLDGLGWLWRRWSPTLPTSGAYSNSVRRTLSQEGVIQNAIDMYRENLGVGFAIRFLLLQFFFGVRWLLGYDNTSFRLPSRSIDEEDRRERAAFFSMPVLGLTGENDGCIDTRLFDSTMGSTNPDFDRVYPCGCSLVRVSGAGHFLFSENPNAVAEALLESFSDCERAPPQEPSDTKLLRADYLVVGAGAMGMAFVDTLITEDRNATVVLVDRYDTPGGHWTLAYPFVSLHQPSSAYGVNSLRLGQTDRMDANNLASKEQILDYYQTVLRGFLQTGRVNYFPGCEADVDSASFASIPTNGNSDHGCFNYRVLARKVVDATYMRVEVAKMRPPPFPIADDSEAVVGTVNDAPKFVERCDRSDFVVMGAGKTGVDAVLELLRLGVPQSRIVWIIPNDSWFILREKACHYNSFWENVCDQIEALLDSSTSQEAFCKLEQRDPSGILRLDPTILPTRFKGATISADDLPRLQTIERKIRLGRIVSIEKREIILEKGTISLPNPAYLIDCTANGLAPADEIPIFAGRRVTLQPCVMLQQVYSAAICAHVESRFPSDEDDAIKNQICVIANHPVKPEDLGKLYYLTFRTYLSMMKHGVMGFHGSSRLNIGNGVPMLRKLWCLFGPRGLNQKILEFVEKVEKGGLKDYQPLLVGTKET